MQITTTNLNKIATLRKRMLRDLNNISYLTGQRLRPQLNEAQHEARLFGALVDAFGLRFANDIADVGEFADDLATMEYLGQLEILEVEAA
jgi:hypothetical protein